MTLLSGFLSSASAITEDVLAAFVKATAEYSLDALVGACDDFATGRIDGRDHHYPPSTAELAQRCDLHQRVIRYREGKALPLHNGLMRIDYGQGSISLAGLTAEQQDQVMRQKGLTLDGRSMAGFSRGEILAAIGEPLPEAIDYDARRAQVQRLIGDALKTPIPNDGRV